MEYNVFGILGLTAIFFPVTFDRENLKFDIPFSVGVSVILSLLFFNFFKRLIHIPDSDCLWHITTRTCRIHCCCHQKEHKYGFRQYSRIQYIQYSTDSRTLLAGVASDFHRHRNDRLYGYDRGRACAFHIQQGLQDKQGRGFVPLPVLCGIQLVSNITGLRVA